MASRLSDLSSKVTSRLSDLSSIILPTPSPVNTKHLYNICTMFDVVPTLYKCYTNVLCLLGILFLLWFKIPPPLSRKWTIPRLICGKKDHRESPFCLRFIYSNRALISPVMTHFLYNPHQVTYHSLGPSYISEDC